MRSENAIRADICASDDHESIARLQEAIGALGGVADDTWHDSPLGTGLTTFRFGERGVSVFIDAWYVDVAGPEDLVNEILAALRG
jgi:hypothetical protein